MVDLSVLVGRLPGRRTNSAAAVFSGFKLQRCVCWVLLAAMQLSMGPKGFSAMDKRAALRAAARLTRMLDLAAFPKEPLQRLGWLHLGVIFSEYCSCIPGLLLLTGGWGTELKLSAGRPWWPAAAARQRDHSCWQPCCQVVQRLGPSCACMTPLGAWGTAA